MNGVAHKCGHDGMGQNLPPMLLWKRETDCCPCPCKSLQDTPYWPNRPTSLTGTKSLVSARVWAAISWLPLVPIQLLNLTAQFKPRKTPVGHCGTFHSSSHKCFSFCCFVLGLNIGMELLIFQPPPPGITVMQFLGLQPRVSSCVLGSHQPSHTPGLPHMVLRLALQVALSTPMTAWVKTPRT